MTTDTDRELWDPRAQTVDPDEQRRTTTAGLREQWNRVWESPIPYYRDVYEQAGLTRDELPPLDEIPRTTKDDLRADVAANPPFGTHRTIDVADALRVGTSTGTTGRPWIVLYSGHDLDEMIVNRLQYLWRVGMRPGGRFAHSWPMGMYPTGVLGGRDYLHLGIMEIPVGLPSTDEQAAQHFEFWEILRPTGFMMSSSQLQIYDRVAREVGVDLPALMEGASLLFSEAACQFEAPRTRIETTYGVRLHNITGASEIPAFSNSDCRFHTGFHVPIGHHLVQVCDPVTGKAVAPGERGTLVVSSYGLDVFFLRYDLQDIVVEVPGPCPCGETGQRYHFLGRAADAAEANGRMVLPLDVQLALEEHGAPEFVLASGRDDELRLKVEAEGSTSTLSGALTEALGVTVAVEDVPVGSLPRSTFKPRRVAAKG